MKTVKKKNLTFYMLGWLMERMPLYVVQYFLYSLSTRMLSVVANVFVLWLVLKLIESPGEEKRILWVLAGAVVYFLVTEWYRACFKEKIQRKARERLTVLLQKQVYDRALEAEISDYENPQFYQTFLLATDNTEEQIENFLASLTDFCGCVVSVLLTMGVFCQIDAGALFFVFLSTMLTLCVQKKTRKILIEKKRLQKEHDRVGAYYYHCFYLREFAKELRLSGIAGLLIRYDEKNNEEYLENIDAVNTRLFGLGLLGQAVPEYFLMKFLLCAYLAYQVLVEKRVDIAGFATIFTAVGELAANLEQLAGKAFPGILENEIFIENFRAFLEQTYEKRPEEKGKMTETPALKTLKVKNLCFSYPGKERQVLKDVSMEIKKHEKIAVVGRNGSGKTTLVLNLIGLYERQSGEIFVNGKSAECFTKKAYRGMFTVLFQDYHLFAVKLAENISMDAEWDEKRVRGVLKKEGLEELADCLTEDFSGEFSRAGRQFSGGQKQRIATGRVLYSSREVLVLDEPSAALDALAEAEFNSRIEKAAKERTVIFISHRLTSVRNADRIYVMEDGCITGEGKHEQLLKDNATYAKMWEIQTGAYK